MKLGGAVLGALAPARRRLGRARLRASDWIANRRLGSGSPCIFIVSEAGQPHFHDDWLAWLGRHEPALRRHLRLAHLPTELPPDTCAVHAWIQDPVRERSASLYAELEALEDAAHARGARVLQPARVLSGSLRVTTCERLASVGLRTPRVVTIDAAAPVIPAGWSFPIVARRAFGHIVAMLRLDDEDAFAVWAAELAEPGRERAGWVLAEYVDTRGADGLFRKYRYVMAGERGVCRHLIASRHWEVRPRDRVMRADTVHDEVVFVSGSCPEHARFDAARRALEYDFVAFDYSFDRDGGLVVWEANPFPVMSYPKSKGTQYLRAATERTFSLVADFYRDLLPTATSDEKWVRGHQSDRERYDNRD